MQTGDVIPFVILPQITREQLHAYANASGDNNPIHLQDEMAQKIGLPGVIAHGMISAAFLAERAVSAVEAAEGLKDWRLDKFSCRFKAMIFPGDEISVGGTVKDASDARMVFDLQAKNQKGEVATLGTAEWIKR